MSLPTTSLFLFVVLLVLVPQSAYAFGAGNVPDHGYLNDIAFRHGDLEGVLLKLGKVALAAGLTAPRFTKADVKRIYFGNWLRDYSQLMDITGLSLVNGSREAILLIVQVLAFMQFGYATKEFLVTEDRLKVYLHVEHIDNPRGYGEDANPPNPKEHHQDLRPLVRLEELEVSPANGMKNYIATQTEDNRYDTSAACLRRTLLKCIDKGRNAHACGNLEGEDMYEAYRLLGSALHTLEDLLAHSNWCELALRKMGHRQVYCHVGDAALIRAPGGNDVPPLTTGTFGSIDMVQSILGECHDHMSSASLTDFRRKADKVRRKKHSLAVSAFKLLMHGKIPSSSPAGKTVARVDDLAEKAEKLKGEQKSKDVAHGASPQTLGFVWEVLEWVEEVMRNVREFLEGTIFDTIAEKLEEGLREVVWFLIASIVEPIFDAIAEEASGQSAELKKAQRAVEPEKGNTDTDPTHTALAKDHFDHPLNEPAGKVAQVVVEHCVTRIVQAWCRSDNAEPLINEILETFHHPSFSMSSSAIQTEMFSCFQGWVQNLADTQKGGSPDKLAAFLDSLTEKAFLEDRCHRELPNVPRMESILGDVTNAALEVLDEVGGFVLDTALEAKKAIEDAPKVIGEAAREVEKAAEEVVQEVGKVVDDAGQVIGEVVADVEKGLDDAGQAVGGVLTDIGNTVDQAVSEAGRGIEEFAGDVAKGAEEAVGDIGKSLEDFGRGAGEVVEDIGRGAEEVVKDIVQGFEDLGHGAEEVVSDIGKGIDNVASDVGRFFSSLW